MIFVPLLVIGGGGASAIMVLTSFLLAITEGTRPFGGGLLIGAGTGTVVGIAIWAVVRSANHACNPW